MSASVDYDSAYDQSKTEQPEHYSEDRTQVAVPTSIGAKSDRN